MTNHSVFQSTKFRVLVGLTLFAGLCAPLTIHSSAQTAATKQVQPSIARQHANALSEAFREVYRSTAPSVVNIRSTQRMDVGNIDEGGELPGNPFNNDQFRRFFGQDAPEGFRQFRFGPSTPTPRERMGEGTGLVVREDGYIVTNNHVVDGATTLKVRLDNETEYDAKVIGTDPETDLAVVKIDASGLSPAHFSNSDSVEIGDWVLALGSPLGLRHTMTAGIVSAKGRGTLGLAEIGDFIQTDCAINPGNSGGPLVNLDGEVVGINTAISTRTGFYMGVGFAIPSNIIKPVITTIIDGGTVKRGWLGVQIGPLSPEAAEYAGFEGTRGVLISDVVPNTPAENAGVKPGDIVTQINGKSVTEPNQLLNTVAASSPGDAAKLTIFRNKKLREINVTLGDRSAKQVANTMTREVPGRQPGNFNLGLSIQDMTPDMARQLGVEEKSGVVVTRLSAGSPAAEAGLQTGDVISMVNESPVAGVHDFTDAIQQADLSKVVRLQVSRQGQTSFFYVKAGKR